MKRCIPSITAFGLFLCLFGCRESEGSTKTSRVTSSLTGFDSIAVSHMCKLKVEKQKHFAIAMKIGERIKPYLEIKKEGTTLHITMRPGIRFHDDTCEGTIAMPNIKQFVVSGAAHIHAVGFHTLKQLKLTSSGAGQLKLTSQVETLTVAASGASRVELEGSAKQINISGSGASRLFLRKLKVQSATLQLSGASRTNIQVEKQLNAVLSGASRLSYAGSPSVQQTTSGVASISQL